MQAKVAERGQVTIPKAIRERLGIAPGTLLDFKADARTPHCYQSGSGGQTSDTLRTFLVEGGAQIQSSTICADRNDHRSRHQRSH